MINDLYTDVAVLVPCYNEEVTIGHVVREFTQSLPGATVYVFDNNSTDQTALRAREAGAEVVPSHRQGKGNVVRHMFDSVEAQVYVLVDGDDTYRASAAPELVSLIRKKRADMVVGTRLNEYDQQHSFRRFHQFGNNLITGLISTIFGIRLADVLSGYRAFSRDFVKMIPLVSKGFEIETEMTLQAISKDFHILETPVPYGVRPAGSHSKLRTLGDGALIIRLIFMILKDYKPLSFFGSIGLLSALASVCAGIPPILDFIERQYVSHVPLAILAAALGLLATISFGIGLTLHTYSQHHNENFRMWRKVIRGVDRLKQPHYHDDLDISLQRWKA